MKRLTLPLALALLVGCTPDTPDPDPVEEPTPDPCANAAQLMSVSPEPDKDGLYTDTVEVTWDAVPEEPVLAVTDAAGDAIDGVITEDDNGRTLRFTASTVFAASTTVHVSVDWVCFDDVAEWTFGTGPYGAPLDDPNTLIDRVMLLDLGSADIVEPAGIGPLLEGFVADVYVLFHLMDVSDFAADELHIMGALGALEEAPQAALDWLIAHLEAPHPVVVTAAGGLASGSTPVAEALSSLLAHEDVGLRRAAASALVSIESAEQALLDAFAVEEDRGARINLAVALAERPSPAVEGVLLELVRGEDPILGAIAAEGLGPRKGGHIVMRLQEAYATANAEGDDERRLAIVRAALPREDASVDLARDAMNDPEPLVREAAWKVVIERFDRATLGELRPPPRPLPALDDPLRGVGDVTGATIQTSVGDIEVTLYPTLAPGAVANWVSLAEAGTYDGRVFFRVVPDFVVQTGDPMDTGWGGPGHTLRCEYTAEPYRRGTLGMATAGKDTGGSQWFITLSPHPHLDGRYTVFGQMSAGHEVLDGIGVGDRVERVVIHRQPQAEKDPAP